MQFRALTILPGLCLVAPSLAAQARAVLPGATDLAKPVPFDTAWTSATLPNGLTYFVRANTRPEKRAELRLVVNAGAVLEADDQQGLAHMTEHMAFNGTQHFKKNDLVHYLQSIGMRFGADVNAYTNQDETVYMLTVPTDTGKFLSTGIEILADWAHGQLFDSAEVESERGVVIEEWRLGQGAGNRMRVKQFPVLFKGSKYAERDVIGDPNFLRTFPQAALRRFYKDWYKPELMAVIAVGDFDKAQVERLIKADFGAIPRSNPPITRPVFPIPPHDSTYVVVTTDKEATNSTLDVLSFEPTRDQTTVGAYRQDLIEALYSSMLGARFSEITQKPNPPFAFAFAGQASETRSADVNQLFVGVPEGGLLRGLDAALTEAERVRRFGFTATEMERAKTNILRAAERANAERDRTMSSSLAAEMIRHFLEGEDVPGPQAEYRMQQQLLPGISLAEVNALAKQTLAGTNRVVLASEPDKPTLAVPTDQEILNTFNAVSAKTLEPYVDAVSLAPLVPNPPAPAAITAERNIPELGVTEWTLANGARVVLKPTDFQADQIVLTGFSPGGTSLLPDSLFVDGVLGTTAVAVGGVGSFSAIDLRKMLSGKVAGAGVQLGERVQTIGGSASPKDVETMFQLLYLRFTAPRKDSAAFVAWRQSTQAAMANMSASPGAAFRDTVQATMSQHSFRFRPLTPALLDEINLDRALAVYRDRFADASQFTFFIVGNFSVDSVKPLVQRYLGGLPSLHRHEAGRDQGISPPPGVVEKTVRRGVEPQSQTFMAFTGPFQYSPQNQYVLSSLGQLLTMRLIDRLREALGGTYSVNASASGSRDAPQRFTAAIQFGSAPERAAELTKAVLDEIQKIKDSGVSAADLTKVREQQLRARETAMRQNGFWTGALGNAYEYGDDPRDILKYPAMVNSLTSDMLRDAARLYFKGDNYVHVTLLPENTPRQ